MWLIPFQGGVSAPLKAKYKMMILFFKKLILFLFLSQQDENAVEKEAPPPPPPRFQVNHEAVCFIVDGACFIH
ncbi:hypothetical protein Bca4012_083933 [Brassica carinata]